MEGVSGERLIALNRTAVTELLDLLGAYLFRRLKMRNIARGTFKSQFAGLRMLLSKS